MLFESGQHFLFACGDWPREVNREVSTSRVPLTRPAMLPGILDSRFWSELNPVNMVPDSDARRFFESVYFLCLRDL